VHEYAQRNLATMLRVPIEQLDLDSQLPFDLLPEEKIEDFKSRYSLIVELGRRDKLTVRQLIGRLGGGRGHLTFAAPPSKWRTRLSCGSPTEPADGFQHHAGRAAVPVLELFVDKWCLSFARADCFEVSTRGARCVNTTA